MFRAWIELSRNALLHNLHEYEKILPANSSVMAVVKADAYGHGASIVAPELERAGVQHFAVASMEEGVQLRVAGMNAPMANIAAYPTAATTVMMPMSGLRSIFCDIAG